MAPWWLEVKLSPDLFSNMECVQHVMFDVKITHSAIPLSKDQKWETQCGWAADILLIRWISIFLLQYMDLIPSFVNRYEFWLMFSMWIRWLELKCMYQWHHVSSREWLLSSNWPLWQQLRQMPIWNTGGIVSNDWRNLLVWDDAFKVANRWSLSTVLTFYKAWVPLELYVLKQKISSNIEDLFCHS